MNKHKYADVIKAWVDGAHIQYRDPNINEKWLHYPDYIFTERNRCATCSGVVLGDCAFEWRILPELKPLTQVFFEAAWPDTAKIMYNETEKYYIRGVEAVIAAYEERKNNGN